MFIGPRRALLCRPPPLPAPGPPPAGFTPDPAVWQVMMEHANIVQSGGLVTSFPSTGLITNSFTPTGGTSAFAADPWGEGVPAATLSGAVGLTSTGNVTVGGGNTMTMIALFQRPVDDVFSVLLANWGGDDGVGISIADNVNANDYIANGLWATGAGYNAGGSPRLNTSIRLYNPTARPMVLRVDMGITGTNHLYRDGADWITDGGGFNVNNAGAIASKLADLFVGQNTLLADLFVGFNVDRSYGGEADSVEGKLAWDAGITLASYHPYFAAPPT